MRWKCFDELKAGPAKSSNDVVIMVLCTFLRFPKNPIIRVRAKLSICTGRASIHSCQNGHRYLFAKRMPENTPGEPNFDSPGALPALHTVWDERAAGC